MKLFALLVAFILVATSLSACAEKDPLLGTWQEPVTGITLEFIDDGTLVISRSGTSFTLEYEKREPNIIAITGSESVDIPVRTLTYQLSEDQLILTVDKVDTVFIRVK